MPLAIVMCIIFGPPKTPLKSSKSCGCETFRVLKYLLSIFLLYTHHCHMILSKQRCCLLLNGALTESQKLTSVRQIRRDFSPTRNMTRIHVGLALSYGKYIYAIDGMVYQQIVGIRVIPIGTITVPLIANLFLYCYERDFMSNLQKSKRFDNIDNIKRDFYSDVYTITSSTIHLDDIFTIDNPAFAEHISDIYPRELQLNKANTSDKETSFLDLNIKVFGNNIHTSVYDKQTLDFPYLIFRGWVVMFLDSHHTVFTFRS